MAFLPNLTFNSSGWGPLLQPEPVVATQQTKTKVEETTTTTTPSPPSLSKTDEASPSGSSECIQKIFPALPYAPFSKSDRIGKVADWTVLASRQHMGRPGIPVSTVFNAFEEEDEEDYSIVETRQKKTFTSKNRPFVRGNRRVLPQQMRPRGAAGGGGGPGGGGPGGGAGQMKGRPIKQKKVQSKYQNQKYTSNYTARTGRKFLPSVEVLPNWGESVQTIEFNTLSSLDKIKVPEGTTLINCGRLEKFNNEVYDKVSVRHERPLEKTERERPQVTTRDDPILQKLMKDGTGNVYATDAILAVLMCATKSMYSWDLLLRKSGDNLIFDKRDASSFDFLTVNENATEPPLDDDPIEVNTVEELHKEATFLNFSFSQQLLLKDEDKVYRCAERNPFQTGPESGSTSIAYFYRKWDIGDGVVVVARTEVDGYKSGKDKPSFMVIKALNEYDPKITGWRAKLEGQQAGCFATEVKNNGNKLAKWAIQCSLANVDEIKLGYVSRTNPRDNFNHAILSVTSHKPNDFYREIGVDIGKMWANLKHVISQLKKLDDGEYIILREGNKKQLLVYRTDLDATTL